MAFIDEASLVKRVREHDGHVREKSAVFFFTVCERKGAPQVRTDLMKIGIEPKSAKLERVAQSFHEVTEEQVADVLKLIDRLEEDDDVQAVYHNMAE